MDVRNARTRRIVLVVDDDPAIRTWLARSLDSLGHVVMTAHDRHGAEAILVDVPVDAIILDLRLGSQSGLAVLDFVRGREALAWLPVLMLTGVSQMTEDEEESILRHGAYVFYKPATIDELHATLHREFCGMERRRTAG